MADAAAIRAAARRQRELAVWTRYQARRQVRRAEALQSAIIARSVLRALESGDLAELEDVQPQLQLIRGGAGTPSGVKAGPRGRHV